MFEAVKYENLKQPKNQRERQQSSPNGDKDRDPVQWRVSMIDSARQQTKRDSTRNYGKATDANRETCEPIKLHLFKTRPPLTNTNKTRERHACLDLTTKHKE